MTAALLTLTALLAADPADRPTPKHSPYARSLPYLTKEEEAKIDRIIDRFILADTGRLTGAEGREARREFDKLGSEAIPNLIRGLNRAARIEHSCPVSVIGRKLRKMLLASNDPELLEFARDEIGSGVGATRHAIILDNLRFGVTLRKNAVARGAATRGPRAGVTRISPGGTTRGGAGDSSLGKLTVEQLVVKAGKERGPELRGVLLELAKRKGDTVLDGFVLAAESYDRDTAVLGRTLLDRRLGEAKEEEVQKRLGHEQAEVRKSAVRVIVAKHPRLTGELIALLKDDQAEVRVLAHQALVRLNGGVDLGPAGGASEALVEFAQQRWRLWWKSRGGR